MIQTIVNRIGSVDQNQDSVTTDDNDNLGLSEILGYSDGYRSVCQNLSLLDSDCQTEISIVVEAWGTLSSYVRCTILTIVEAEGKVSQV